MSQLGQAIRTYLTGYTGYAASLPGGISPDQAPQANTAQPYAVYQSGSRNRQVTTSGLVAGTTESVQLTVIATTRVQAQTSAQWVSEAIRAVPGRQTIGTLAVQQWRVDNEQAQNEIYADGSDESARMITLEITGSYTE